MELNRVLFFKILGRIISRAGEPEPGDFGSLELEPLEKNQEPESLGKKVRIRSR